MIDRLSRKVFGELEMGGDAIALAAGLAVALAFVYLIEEFVTSMIGPLISLFVDSFETAAFSINGSEFRYGLLVLALINFVLVLAAAWLLLWIVARKRSGTADGMPAGTRACPECTMPISTVAKRCPHCTAVVGADI